ASEAKACGMRCGRFSSLARIYVRINVAGSSAWVRPAVAGAVISGVPSKGVAHARCSDQGIILHASTVCRHDAATRYMTSYGPRNLNGADALKCVLTAPAKVCDWPGPRSSLRT